MSKRRILVTGAAGRIGGAFCAYVGDRYDLRLAVHHLSKLKDPGEHDVIELDSHCGWISPGRSGTYGILGTPDDPVWRFEVFR